MRSFLAALLALSAVSPAAPPAKKKAPKAATRPADPPELKAAPTLQPVPLEPTPATAALPQPRPSAPTPTPTPVTPEKPEKPVTVTQQVAIEPPQTTPRAGLTVQARGGVVVPLGGLRAGGRAELRAAYWLGSLPLAVSLGLAFEQHTSRSAATFAPPAGGLDEAALDNQTVLPVEASVLVALFRDEHNRVHLGAGYGLLLVWSQTVALGDIVLERGLGHEVLGEAGYTRRVGPLELSVGLRYSVRRTAIGPRTSSVELPWYQTFGVVAGLGFCL